ncbi:LPS export ABC transporter periplasmic protein LptC [Cloacibacillus evryensis]|uniref:LPS export ABC transporter periplasmic protein LptC n=1 Tax=Cloacibacillus evryensis TaxID=508460 RepID=UPI00210A42A3|nr:LPS export ABC transporter periplasmic protein LptC [Cloacibacillus evryensis]MCQ4763377.1 LPS export ABC transporter periplasmic protein LptC [Cloacibacillus evryensis]
MIIEKRLRRFCAVTAFCLICAALPAAAAPAETVKRQNTLSADDIQYNVNTGDARAKGRVVITRDGSVLKGDEAEGNTEKEVMTIRGNVDGSFPGQQATLKSESATWTGDKTKKTDGVVEAFGKVLLTRAPKDRLNADYVLWEIGTENYKARGNVDGILDNRILKAAEATRTGDKFWARDVRRYEDLVQKFVLSSKTMEGRLAKDAKSGQDTLQEMVADQNVVFDYVDKDGLKTRVTGDKAVYSKARGTIVVSGNTKAVRSDGKTVTADTMVVHEDTRNIEAKGNSKIVFVVEEKAKKEEDAKNTGTAKAGAPAKKGSPPAAETKPASEDKKPAAETKNSQLTDEEKNWVEK